MRFNKLFFISFVSFLSVFGGNCFADNIEESIEQAQALSRAFSHVAEKVMPSVVNISAVKNYQAQVQKFRSIPFNGNNRSIPLEEFFGEDFFDRLFPPNQVPFGQGQRDGSQTYKQQSGMGTGFVIDSDGHILTNNHVIEGADEIEVKTQDNHVYKAKIVGRDDSTDLAVLKIDTKEKLVPLSFGNSDQLKIGEWVVAVGNPFGLDHTITTGVVSAKGRSISPGSMMYEDYIQTDAAINPGNSGGPLVNLYGEVVGINSAIFSKSGGYMGIGFAIPINLAKSVVDSLTKNGKVVRGWLGVAIQNLTDDLANSFNFKGTEGALIGDVTPDGPAAKAGLKTEDIIVKFDNKDVKDVNQLRFMVAASSPNKTVEVEVFRDGRYKTFDVKLSELADPKVTTPVQQEDENVEDIGLNVQTLDSQLRKQLGINSKSGVVVTGVAPYSIAANAGIRPSDLIIKVAGKEVNTSQEFLNEIKKYSLSEGIRLVVETSGLKHFVVLRK